MITEVVIFIYIFQRVQYTCQNAIPTTVIKQENVADTCRKQVVNSSVSQGQVVTPTSTMSPMIEIKKEVTTDEMPSPQTKIEPSEVPNSVSGDPSTSSLLDANGK